MNENYYNDELQINLIDLVFYLLKQWKTLLLAIIIGAVLGGGIYMVKKPEAVTVPVGEEVEDLQETYELDPEVKIQMELALRYRQLYNQQLEYNEKSLIMQMDPGAVYTGELEYYIAAGNDTRLLSERFLNVLNDESLLADLKRAADLDCEEQYLHEIISGFVEWDENIAAKDSDSATITYKISFTDKISCEKMLDVVRERVEALDQEYQEAYEDGYIFENVNDSVKLIINNDYLTKQKSSADMINSYWNNIKNLENSFSEEDKEYYEMVYLSRETADDEEGDTLEAVGEPVNQVKSLVKWIVIGVLLMCVCWGGFYFIKYLFDGRVKSASEITHSYSLKLLGRIQYRPRKTKGISGLIEKVDAKRKGDCDSLVYIAASIQALGSERVLLCMDQNNGESCQIVDTLKQQCPGLQVGGNIHLESTALNTAKSVDGVILTAIIGVTEQKQLKRELDVCRLQHIPVLGIVVLE